MIGQDSLKAHLRELIRLDKLPQFIILFGKKGSGKKCLTKYIYECMTYFNTSCYLYTLPDVKIDTIRETISVANSVNQKMLVLIHDADNMSLQAKNALLKLVEEPRNNIYIVMTLQDVNNTLDTLKSRARMFSMLNYKVGELMQYIDFKDLKVDSSILNIAETPGEINDLLEMNVEDLLEFVNLVADSIAECEPANAFKSGGRINLSNEDTIVPDKYDLYYFWKTFISVCYSRLHNTGDSRYYRAVDETSRYLRLLRRSGVNKKQLYDLWVFDIRECLF